MPDERFPYVVFDTPNPCTMPGTKITGYVFRDMAQAREFANRVVIDGKSAIWMAQARLYRVEGETSGAHE